MGALDPACAIHNRAGLHAGPAQQFQRDARAYDVHDGIQRARFMEANLLRRHAVNPALGQREAAEDSHRLALGPGREGCLMSWRCRQRCGRWAGDPG